MVRLNYNAYSVYLGGYSLSICRPMKLGNSLLSGLTCPTGIAHGSQNFRFGF